MKLERSMRRYYQSMMDGVRPPELPEFELKEKRLSPFRRIMGSDMALNALVNGAIAAVLVFGYVQQGRESVLAGALRRHAEELYLNRRIGTGLESLSGKITDIRKSYR
jgi:hypothetical protein